MELPRDLLGGLDIRFQDGVLLVLLPGEPSSVHVDRHQRFGLVDRDVAAALQPHLPVHRLLELRFDSKVIEDRLLAPVELHARAQLRDVVLQIVQDLLVAFLRVDHQLTHVFREDVPDQARGQLHLAMENRRRFRAL